MKKQDFYYDLPQELIAQFPIEPRDCSRLFIVDRKSGELEHKHFYDIVDYLNKGDCLVINNTKVMPVRIFGVKESTGAIVEFLLLNQKEQNLWECMAGPGKKAKSGDGFSFNDGVLNGKILKVLENGNRLVLFSFDKEKYANIFEVLSEIGEMPLPPYIKEKLKDKNRYNTVYAKDIGSAAAPTAGLHFTDELLAKIKDKGVNIGELTLHVGIGTFRPVKTDDIKEHRMHSEHYHMSKETADLINRTKAEGKRVIAVGTTSVRTVESVFLKFGEIKEDDDMTEIFIYPGYKYKCVDAIITNFHLPESTLIMLISAFYDRKKILNAYETAVKEKYRFFSFGDAMFIK